MYRWFLLLLVCSACNRVFGIADTDLREILDAPAAPDADPRADHDGDGIKDVEDPCIASEVDLLIDSDGDTLANGDDPCPFDPAATGDADGDGIGDVCDPSGTPDRVRCVMALSDPDLNIAMWRVRDDPLSWQLYYPRALVASSAGSIAAGFSFESPAVTTIAVTGHVPPSTTRFAVYPRAAHGPAADEVGCELVAGTAWSLATAGSPQTSLGPYPASNNARFWMQLVVTPAANDSVTLRCRARLGTNPIAKVETRAALPAGTVGFATTAGGTVTSIVIYERDDAP